MDSNAVTIIIAGIVANPVIQWGAAVIFLVGMIYLLRFIAKKYKTDTCAAQDVAISLLDTSRDNLDKAIVSEVNDKTLAAGAVAAVHTLTDAVKNPPTGACNCRRLSDPDVALGSSHEKVLPADQNVEDTKPVAAAAPESEESDDDSGKTDKIRPGPVASVILLLIMAGWALSACSLLGTAASYFKDNVEITWKNGEGSAIVGQPIDSIVVHFNSAYWKEDVKINPDSVYVESEKDFDNNGYSVWTLQTPNWRRYEVRKLDTVIYIYKKSK